LVVANAKAVASAAVVPVRPVIVVLVPVVVAPVAYRVLAPVLIVAHGPRMLLVFAVVVKIEAVLARVKDAVAPALRVI
jgi:hypothetical protein